MHDFEMVYVYFWLAVIYLRGVKEPTKFQTWISSRAMVYKKIMKKNCYFFNRSRKKLSCKEKKKTIQDQSRRIKMIMDLKKTRHLLSYHKHFHSNTYYLSIGTVTLPISYSDQRKPKLHSFFSNTSIYSWLRTILRCWVVHKSEKSQNQ